MGQNIDIWIKWKETPDQLLLDRLLDLYMKIGLRRWYMFQDFIEKEGQSFHIKELIIILAQKENFTTPAWKFAKAFILDHTDDDIIFAGDYAEEAQFKEHGYEEVGEIFGKMLSDYVMNHPKTKIKSA